MRNGVPDVHKRQAHCYEGEKPLLKDVLKKGADTLVLIGPEGDFSEEEVKKAIEKGFIPISLGKSRPVSYTHLTSTTSPSPGPLLTSTANPKKEK